jgi:hypothetical protein
MKAFKCRGALFGAFFVISLPWTSACAATNLVAHFATYGLGASSCASYLSDVEKIKVAADSYWNWLVGFLSAENLYVEGSGDVLKDIDRVGAVAWIEKYCARNPTASYQHAVANLSLFLTTRQNSDPLAGPFPSLQKKSSTVQRLRVEGAPMGNRDSSLGE